MHSGATSVDRSSSYPWTGSWSCTQWPRFAIVVASLAPRRLLIPMPFFDAGSQFLGLEGPPDYESLTGAACRSISPRASILMPTPSTGHSRQDWEQLAATLRPEGRAF